MAETGTLAAKPVFQIFREMALGSRSGVLRVTTGRRIRAVVFLKGEAVFALSNIPEEQLDVMLVRQGKLTRDQAVAAKSKISKEHELGRKLVETGLLDADSVTRAMEEQIRSIVFAALQTPDGEYVLDPAARAGHDVALAVPMGRLLAEAARATPPAAAFTILGGDDAVVSPVEGAAGLPGTVLSSAEAYLLSRLSGPKTVADLGNETGIALDELLPQLLALAAAGFATSRPQQADEEEDPGRPAGDEPLLEDLRRELADTLLRFRSADHYGVLGIERSADATEVKRAYYALAKRYHPDRFHHASVPDVRERLESIFALVTKAYETLKDGRLRAEYDARLGPAPPRAAAPPPPPRPAPPPKPPPPAAPAAPAAKAAPPKPAPPKPASPPAPSKPAPAPKPEPPPAPPPAPAPAAAGGGAPEGAAEPPRAPIMPAASPAQLAEQAYQRGIQHFEKKDLINAVNFLREAVRLDPKKSLYQYHLGTALALNPRWMREAERHLLEAARMEPLSVDVLLALGGLYKSVNLAKRAETQYRSVLSLSPGNAAARRALAELGVRDIPALKGQPDAGSGAGLFSKLFKKK